jgi:hypothetical protein
VVAAKERLGAPLADLLETVLQKAPDGGLHPSELRLRALAEAY